MNVTKTLLSMFALALAPLASADTPERMARNLAELERFALTPVEEIRSYRFYDWKPLGDRHLALWTRPNADVFIIEVYGPCMDLPWTRTIATTTTTSVLSARFDSIRVGRDSCRIKTITPVDWRALRAERKAQRARDRR